uniref:Gem nuclear organelle associated protein 6 n=1 Tax=Amblyomma aureolatum TaxID=187763 RepID=A0A1E1X0D2_9ACAR
MEPESKMSPEQIHDSVCNDDPLLLLSYVHKLVRVETTDGRVLAGYVKTIDPVSKCIVMALLDSGRPVTVHVIMGHAVKSLTVVTDAAPAEKEQIEQLFMPQRMKLSNEQLRQKKEKLRSWMCINRIPVAESADQPGVLVIAGSVRLLPPYGPEDFQCTNSLVLGKIRGIISSMPVDIESWTSPYEPMK